jgi:hypothetical protein
MYKTIEVGADEPLQMAHSLLNRLRASDVVLESVPYAVNIGCGDGREYNDQVYALYKSGFKGVAIDGQTLPGLDKNLGSFDVFLRPGTVVDTENIVRILTEAECPNNPSFLKIDIDGVDADILRSILKGGIRPCIIQAEINSEIPPPYAFSVCSSEGFIPGGEHGFYGFSLSYGNDLLERYGYRLLDLDFETRYCHDGLWIHESVAVRAGIAFRDPVEQFMSKPPKLPHVDAASKAEKIAWRTRTDLYEVRSEIWRVMLECERRKLGTTDAPFELYISDS